MIPTRKDKEQRDFSVSTEIPTTLDLFIGHFLKGAALLPALDAVVFETELKQVVAEIGVAACLYAVGELHSLYVRERYNLR